METGTQKPVRAGLIGCGDISASHLKSYAACGIELAALCDVDTARAEKRRAEFAKPDTPIFADHRELLKMADVDFVTVATPVAYHAPLTIDALRAGKHVACEKPSTLSLAQNRAIIEEAKKAGKKVIFFSSRMRWGGPELAAEYINEGALGDIYRVDVQYLPPPRPPRPGRDPGRALVPGQRARRRRRGDGHGPVLHGHGADAGRLAAHERGLGRDLSRPRGRPAAGRALRRRGALHHPGARRAEHDADVRPGLDSPQPAPPRHHHPGDEGRHQDGRRPVLRLLLRQGRPLALDDDDDRLAEQDARQRPGLQRLHPGRARQRPGHRHHARGGPPHHGADPDGPPQRRPGPRGQARGTRPRSERHAQRTTNNKQRTTPFRSTCPSSTATSTSAGRPACRT